MKHDTSGCAGAMPAARGAGRRTARRLAPCAVALLVAACGDDRQTVPGDASVAETAAARPAQTPFEASPQDSAIFAETMAWARAEGLAELPIGEIIARVATRFVGAPYVPSTLEIEGDERLVVNLRTFDCVTLVESTLAIARLVRAGSDSFADFRRELQQIRYRDGALHGYISRLHYFSDWIGDNERRGLVEDVTAAIGGVVDPEPINFMSNHADAYRQLSDPAVLESVRAMESRVTERTRHVVPQARIGEVAASIRNGDIIAATSSVAGLDVAHTGFAYWQDGALHLLHAPLVGTVVEISEQPLAQRILRIATQDGIMVARPQ